MLFSSIARRGIRSSLNSRSTLLGRNSSTGPGIPSNVLRSWYSIFGKSNAAYITWIVGGVLTAELITGFGLDSIWNSVNSGRTYESVDWEKFKAEDDDDDDEEDDEDEEEEGGDDDEEEEDDE